MSDRVLPGGDILEDGSVLPSHQGVSSNEQSMRRVPMRDGFAMREGVITKIYYPGDPGSTNSQVIEYDVRQWDENPNGVPYLGDAYRCVVLDTLGGKGDVMHWTLRVSEDQTDPDPVHQNGSNVLILCMHGNKQNGYIIGGSRHRQGKAQSKADGHQYEFEFNGWNMTVNNDGECIMTYKSKTNTDGAPQDTEAGGTFMKFHADGSWELNDDKAIRVYTDKPNSDIIVENTGRDMFVTIKRDSNLKTDRDLNVEVGRKAVVSVVDQILVDAGKNIEVQTNKSFLVDVADQMKCTVGKDILMVTSAKFMVEASSKAQLKAPLVELTSSGSTGANDGVITGQSVDPFTGVPHIDFSGVVRATK